MLCNTAIQMQTNEINIHNKERIFVFSSQICIIDERFAEKIRMPLNRKDQ